MVAESFDETGAASTLLVPRSAPAGGSFAILVVEGPDAGSRFAIGCSRPYRVLLGQSMACEIRLNDRLVSRRHAAVDLTEARLRIIDESSSNGTFLDGVAIRDAYWDEGGVVRMGASALRLVRQGAASDAALPEETSFGRVVGASPAMRRLYPLCKRLAATMVPVIIEGETGTGKEALAEALHEMGPRAAKPYVVFDCTAVAPTLIESELFGHERGAYTSAVRAEPGAFERAKGGTLLVDEIGDLDLPLQAKLLRAIDRSEVRRVGGDKTMVVDVRVLAATRRDLDREVQEGRFREDLFHRLAVARIELPPLRARRGDIALLAQHFWEDLQGGAQALPNDVLRRWQDEPWPGNVRQLRNAVARHVALGDLAHLAGRQPTAPASGDMIDDVLALGLKLPVARRRLLEQFERRYIEAVLAQHGGNVARAAEASGVARRYFQILRARQSK